MTDDDDTQDYVRSWKGNEIIEKIRNDTLEEVAKEIEKMKAFGPDTTGSFAVYIRNMKS
jgi:hypothetical protein